MKTKVVLTSILIAFIGLCGILVVESGLFNGRNFIGSQTIIPLASQATMGADTAEEETKTDAPDPVPADANKESGYDFSKFSATQAKLQERTLGDIDLDQIERTSDPEKFKFLVEFTTKGAGIRRVMLSEFDNRDPDNPENLLLLSSWDDNVTLYPMANGYFGLTGREVRFPLHKLNWVIVGAVAESYESEKIVFEAILKDAAGKDVFKFTKTFRVTPGSYDIECDLTIENLSSESIEAKYELQGPGGIVREGARGDMRKVVAAYMKTDGKVETEKMDNAKLRKALKKNKTEDMLLESDAAQTHFVWGAVTNKYFAAILRPIPEEGDWPKNVLFGGAQYSDPEFAAKSPGPDAVSGFSLKVQELKLAPAGEQNASKTYKFHLYVGPKDKDLFDTNPEYDKYAYLKTIDFRGCCCPTKIISPLAFGIMGLMKWMYKAMGPLGNYGVVIMVLVFLVRLIMHPVTKKSQVSMMKMQKLGPMMEEIKKKYANNKQELNKKVMELYKEQGVSPVASFLPMMLQMPIWIALWTAIYTSIELRGAGFLPFWITDLSAPDALIRFKEFTIPLVNWHIDSFNLLPILMGVVMFLQQKLMPHSQSAQTNPQVAQQQKMMMIMMPLMFPIMLYKGPSGVNLYIMSSISAGVIEQIIIRKHIREKEEAESQGLVAVTKKTGGKVKKKKPKPFFKS